MKFDKNELRVFEGQKITLNLNHTGKMSKEIMGHNFVLLKKDTDLNDFAQRAMLARENEYIPDGDETIVYTNLIGGGESDTITFHCSRKRLLYLYMHIPWTLRSYERYSNSELV